MATRSTLVAVAAPVGLAGLAFAPLPVGRQGSVASSLRGRGAGGSAGVRGSLEGGRGTATSALLGSTAPLALASAVVAAGAAAAAAVQMRRRARASRVAAPATLTKDGQGRFRFDAAGPPLPTVEKKDYQEKEAKPASPVLTKNTKGLFRFTASSYATMGKPSRVAKAAGSGSAVSLAEQPGVTAPLGFFDPLWVSKGNDFKQLRAAEVKHGRIGMMAATGSLVAGFVQLPGLEGVPTGLAALNSPAALSGLGCVIAVMSAIEMATYAKQEQAEAGDNEIFDHYVTPSNDVKTRELNNGRLGMLAIVGQVAAELATGSSPLQQLGL